MNLPSEASVQKIRQLQVILKTAERCNLACDYCYYFYGGDDSYKDRPAVITTGVVASTAKFLAQGCAELGISTVKISFHGGEPMLQKPHRFAETCETFLDALRGIADVSFTMQTNGTLFSKRWLDVLSNYDVELSISIDGLKDQHDLHRFDHRGRGSFDRIAAGIGMIHDYRRNARLAEPSVLGVMNADYDIREFVRVMKEQHGIRGFGFLLPDCNVDSGIPNGHTAEDYGQLLCDLFDEWVSDPTVGIREVNRLLYRFQRAEPRRGPETGKPSGKVRRNQVIVIHSDGEVSVDDTFMPAAEWRNSLERSHVDRTTLAEHLARPMFAEIAALYEDTPAKCRECCWKNICNGGDLENRYSASNGFANPSVYCAGLKIFYSRVVSYLAASGYPAELLMDRLVPDSGRTEMTYAL